MNARIHNLRLRPITLLFLFLLVASCGQGIKNLTSSSAPSISGVSTSRNADGTVTVTISGAGFEEGSTVTINSTPCTNVHVLSSTQLNCILPNGNIALVNIVITTPSGGSSGGAGGGGGGGGVSAYHTVFVENTYARAQFGSLAAADTLCNTAAQAGSKTKNITGHWRAILAASGVRPQSRITFVAGSSIKNTHGDTVLTDSSQLWNFGNLLAPMGYDANGTSFSGWSAQIWTGAKSGTDCLGWTSSDASPLGETGDSSSTTGTWWDSGSDYCDDSIGSFLCINSNN